MNIKTEILRGYVANFICARIEDFDIVANEIANSRAINALGEIQLIIQNDELSDFEMVEEIVNIFEKYELDFGATHDFG